jgi:hypothetical protein
MKFLLQKQGKIKSVPLTGLSSGSRACWWGGCEMNNNAMSDGSLLPMRYQECQAVYKGWLNMKGEVIKKGVKKNERTSTGNTTKSNGQKLVDEQ